MAICNSGRMNSPTVYLGIDIGGTKTALSMASASAGILAREEFASGAEPEPDLMKMIRIGKRLCGQFPGAAGIGISVGAMFDPVSGRFREAPHKPAWEGFPIVKAVSEAFALPVAADNDANACALAEWKYGAGRGARHMAFLTFGTGLGAGLILDGRLYRGASGLAGEIGTMRIADDGPPVRGIPGCLEGYASGAGIAGLAALRRGNWSEETALSPLPSAREVASAAVQGDTLAGQILTESGDALGRGLAILIDLLNLEIVVIGSIFVRCETLLRPPMEAAIRRDAMTASASDCRILPAALGEEIGDYAALALAVEHTAMAS
jgi:glucokinase